MCETILDPNLDLELYMEMEVPPIRPQTHKNPLGTSKRQRHNYLLSLRRKDGRLRVHNKIGSILLTYGEKE